MLMVASAAAGMFLLGVIFSTQLLAQGHAGHTAQKSTATEKTKTVKPEARQEETAAEDVPQIEISPEQQQLIGVKTVKVAVKSMQKVIRTVGRIEADEQKLATINTKVEGWIEKLYVDYTGRYVRKGEPLVGIYSPELLATQQEYLSILKWTAKKTVPEEQPGADAQSGRDQKKSEAPSEPVSELRDMIANDAKATVAAARERLRLWDISEEQINRIEETGKPIRTLIIYSPVSGFVTQKAAIQGMKVMPGEKLFDIADLSTLWILADIYEYELPFVRVGQQARITLAYFPGREMTSRIDYIYPTISADTRTAKVRLTLQNPKGDFKPQMFTNVEIRISLGKKLVVPESAVIDTGVEQVVYVDRGNGVYEPRVVQVGLRADGAVEVLRGLKGGEKVVSSANFLIDSEAQLKGVKPLRKP
jgi:Cu(I)/Ag(I) efflux system membrane fusion protein